MDRRYLRYIRIAICVFLFAFGYLMGGKTQTIEHNHYIHIVSEAIAPEVVVPKNSMWLCTTETCDDAGWVHVIPETTIKAEADREFECMATTIYFEAAIEPYEGKLAVGEVIMNRVDDPKYPATICDVIQQPWQFSWYKDGVSNLPNRTTHSWGESVRAAEEVMFSVTSRLRSDVQYYHADYVDPYWAKKMTKVTKIGAHIFYRL